MRKSPIFSLALAVFLAALLIAPAGLWAQSIKVGTDGVSGAVGGKSVDVKKDGTVKAKSGDVTVTNAKDEPKVEKKKKKKAEDEDVTLVQTNKAGGAKVKQGADGSTKLETSKGSVKKNKDGSIGISLP